MPRGDGKVLDTGENTPQSFLTRLLRCSEGDMPVCVSLRFRFFSRYFAFIFDIIS